MYWCTLSLGACDSGATNNVDIWYRYDLTCSFKHDIMYNLTILLYVYDYIILIYYWAIQFIKSVSFTEARNICQVIDNIYISTQEEMLYVCKFRDISDCIAAFLMSLCNSHAYVNSKIKCRTAKKYVRLTIFTWPTFHTFLSSIFKKIT